MKTCLVLLLSCFLAINNSFSQNIERLAPPNNADNWALFGSSVHIENGYLFVGSPARDTDTHKFEYIYIYKRVTNTWQKIQQIRTQSTASVYTNMSARMAVAGDWLVFSELTSSADCFYRLFKREGEEWIEKQQLPGISCGNSRTSRIGMDEKHLMIGGDGRLIVYEFEEEEAVQVQEINTSGGGFGEFISVSGKVMVVAAPSAFTNGNFGVAHVYEKNDAGNWGRVKTLAPSDSDINHNWATGVFVHDDLIAVADFNGSGNTEADSSAIYFYRKIAGQWQEVFIFRPQGGQNLSGLGRSFAMEGKSLYIGAPQWRSAVGRVFHFEVETDDIKLVDVIEVENGGDNLGYDLDVEDGKLVIGAPHENILKGAVYMSRVAPDVLIGVLDCWMPFDYYGATVDGSLDQQVLTRPDGQGGEEEVVVGLFYDMDSWLAHYKFTGIYNCELDQRLMTASSFFALPDSLQMPPNVRCSWATDVELNGQEYHASDFLDDTTALLPRLINAPQGKIIPIQLTFSNLQGDSLCAYDMKIAWSCSGVLRDTIYFEIGDSIRLTAPCFSETWYMPYWEYEFDFIRDLEVTIAPEDTANISFSGGDNTCDFFYDVYLLPLPIDQDMDGFPESEDCDDTNPDINPDATELCNGIDDNCNGLLNEDLEFIVYYADLDGDGYGDLANTLDTCLQVLPEGYSENSLDCDDTDLNISPMGVEIPNNGIDEDCDGQDLIVNGLSDLSANTFKIFPNPAQDRIEIQSTVGMHYELRLRNALGQVLAEYNDLEAQASLLLPDLAEGLYWLEFRALATSQLYSQKLLIQKR